MSCDYDNSRAPAVSVVGVVSVDHVLGLILHTCLCGAPLPSTGAIPRQNVLFGF